MKTDKPAHVSPARSLILLFIPVILVFGGVLVWQLWGYPSYARKTQPVIKALAVVIEDHEAKMPRKKVFEDRDAAEAELTKWRAYGFQNEYNSGIEIDRCAKLINDAVDRVAFADISNSLGVQQIDYGDGTGARSSFADARSQAKESEELWGKAKASLNRLGELVVAGD